MATTKRVRASGRVAVVSVLVLTGAALGACGSAHKSAVALTKSATATTSSASPTTSASQGSSDKIPPVKISYGHCSTACWEKRLSPPLPASAVKGLYNDCLSAHETLPKTLPRAKNQKQLEQVEQEYFGDLTHEFQDFATSAARTIDAVPHPNEVAEQLKTSAAGLASEYAKGPGEAMSVKAQGYAIGMYIDLALLHVGCEMTNEPKGFRLPSDLPKS
jgi:hypothetical protein